MTTQTIQATYASISLTKAGEHSLGLLSIHSDNGEVTLFKIKPKDHEMAVDEYKRAIKCILNGAPFCPDPKLLRIKL